MHEIPLDPTELAVVFLAIGAGAFIKGLTGTGFPLVAVPIMAIFLGVEHAVIVLQIPNLLSNLWLVWRYRDKMKTTPHPLGMFFPSGIAIFLGVWFLSAVDRNSAVMFLAAMLGVFLILLVIKPDLTLKGLALKIVTPVASTIGGFAQGATGVSGPVYTPLIFSMRMPKEAFIYYHGILYGFFNVVQISAMIWFGLFTPERFFQGLISLIPLFLFQYVGMMLTERVSLSTFNKAVIGIMILMEAKLLIDAISG